MASIQQSFDLDLFLADAVRFVPMQFRGANIIENELYHHQGKFRRASAFHHNPSFFHFSSTICFTSALVLFSLGQRRSKPSFFHLRVPSTPIFDPKPICRAEWSSTSTGPSMN